MILAGVSVLTILSVTTSNIYSDLAEKSAGLFFADKFRFHSMLQKSYLIFNFLLKNLSYFISHLFSFSYLCAFGISKNKI